MILGAVLAGGASSRMGVDKASVLVGGRSMVELVTGALGAVADRVVIAGRSSSVSGFAGVPDPVSGRVGPLAGLAAALSVARDCGAEAVIVVAVDQPFVRPETLARLVERHAGQAVVPSADGVRQVTCAVYPTSWRPEARAELETGGSIQSLLDRMPHATVPPEEWAARGEDGRSWFSVDDAGALAAGLERFGSVLE